LWTIPRGRSKNNEPNALPLPPQALSIIDALPQSPSGLLFSTTGRTQISGFSKMKRILDAAVAKRKKLAPWTLHDLRRSAATGMAERGVAPHVVDLVLGHKPLTAVASIYNRSKYLDEKRAALNEWALFFETSTVIWG
jgi:integrase